MGQYVHPRAREYFTCPGELEQILSTIAARIDKNDDPVLGSDARCVPWRGDIIHGNNYILAQDLPENADSESLVTSTLSWQELQTGSRGSRGNILNRPKPQAVFRLVKPGEEVESVTYINRILSFIFAEEESFELLMRLPKEPFSMNCGNQLCIHLSHISVEP